MTDLLPEGLLKKIQVYLQEGVRHAEKGWEAGSDEEDTLTGDLGANLRTKRVRRFGAGTEWKWTISYKKFRGRGKHALEKTIGADGIIQIEVYPDTDDNSVITKGVLFQAKKVTARAGGLLGDQIRKMNALAPGGWAIFEYGPDGYFASNRENVPKESRPQKRESANPLMPLGSFLADEFLSCRAGLRGMHFNANRRLLSVPNVHDASRLVEIHLDHRLNIEIRHKSRLP